MYETLEQGGGKIAKQLLFFSPVPLSIVTHWAFCSKTAQVHRPEQLTVTQSGTFAVYTQLNTTSLASKSKVVVEDIVISLCLLIGED